MSTAGELSNIPIHKVQTEFNTATPGEMLEKSKSCAYANTSNKNMKIITLKRFGNLQWWKVIQYIYSNTEIGKKVFMVSAPITSNSLHREIKELDIPV